MITTKREKSRILVVCVWHDTSVVCGRWILSGIHQNSFVYRSEFGWNFQWDSIKLKQNVLRRNRWWLSFSYTVKTFDSMMIETVACIHLFVGDIWRHNAITHLHHALNCVSPHAHYVICLFIIDESNELHILIIAPTAIQQQTRKTANYFLYFMCFRLTVDVDLFICVLRYWIVVVIFSLKYQARPHVDRIEYIDVCFEKNYAYFFSSIGLSSLKNISSDLNIYHFSMIWQKLTIYRLVSANKCACLWQRWRLCGCLMLWYNYYNEIWLKNINIFYSWLEHLFLCIDNQCY